MNRYATLRVTVDFATHTMDEFWSWQCEHCGAHGHAYPLDHIEELVDLAELHAGCAGLLLSDALHEGTTR